MKKSFLIWIAPILALLSACGFPTPASAAGCPNELLRTGASAALPDCRAYELMTPPDSNGRLVEGISGFTFEVPHDVFPTELLSPVGDSFIYLAYSGPLGELSEANGTFDLYEARRSIPQWSTTRRLTPSGAETSVSRTLGGVSPDHQFTFITVGPVKGIPGGSLAANGIAEYLGKPDGSFQVIGIGSLGKDQFAQGRFITSGGDHVIFTTGKSVAQSIFCSNPSTGCIPQQLEPNAPPDGTGAVYDREADGPTHVVSLLPGNQPQLAGEEAFYKGSSKNAASIAFEIEGTLYVRVNSGVAADEDTLKVAAGKPVFGGLSDDGRYLFYVAGGESGTIHRFDTETEADIEINSMAEGEIVNVSADGSHIYFISQEEISGEGRAGEPNLYVWKGGSTKYIVTVASSDLERTSGTQVGQCPSLCGIPALTRWTNYAVVPPSEFEPGPGADSSRTTPDGSVLVFESRGQLTSYDNAGHTEVYRYDDSDGSLICVSCSPAVEPAQADAQLQELRLIRPGVVIHNLSSDGSRVFFETDEALVEPDVDDVNDIYEWSEGEGFPTLISSGESTEFASGLGGGGEPFLPSPNVLFSITPSGNDVAFLSQDALVSEAGAGGVPAIYDARVGGGFPEPGVPQICLEEGCRGPVSSASRSFGGARSEDTHGAGNVKPRKHRCRPRSKHHRRKPRRCGRRRSRKGHARLSSAASGFSVQAMATPKAQAPIPSASPTYSTSSNTRASISTRLAGGEFESFGIESVGVEESNAVAGAHPDFTTRFSLNHRINKEGLPVADARVEKVSVSLPPGLLGNPAAFPRCNTGEFIAASCPTDSQVGFARSVVDSLKGEVGGPIYNLEPPHPEEEVARLGFIAVVYPVFIDIAVRSASDYGVTATVHSAPGGAPLISSKVTLWGSPADPSHDDERFPPGGVDIPRNAFMTNPSACQKGEVDFEVTSYQLPGQVFGANAPLEPITDCAGMPFAPGFSAEPTSHAAGAPTGLKTKLVLPQHLGAEDRATATMREARVTLPEGMQIDAGAANWIDTCSDVQVGFHEEVDAVCPNASKLGTATIASPSLPEPIEGALYQRNPTPGHQFGLWLVADALGLHIKIPGELEPDKQNGRLTAVFSDLPQVPVEEIDLDVWGGPRAPLQNPATCGTYTTDFSFSPHSQDPAAAGQDQMQIDEGCSLPFDPTIHAGVENAVAGQFSPFVFDLTRPDGSQALRGFELHMPDGELAKLAGVPLCGEGAAAAGTCPADSRIGSLTAVSGPGPDPLEIPQSGKTQPAIYLAGPYQGAPYSIVSEVPAQAGPFDLGILAVRSALAVDPETVRATVKADPLPQFFEGVGIAYRHLHAVVDRPGFSLNPTDCQEMAVTSDVTSTQGTVAHPAARFQVDGCKALKFKPKLSLQLKGGTKRGEYPALTATLKARKGDANIAKTSVGLPHSEFLAQEHIVTICTRVQFAADKCPKGSIYGKAKAWTPLLDKPLEGPVYLRSSSHSLPDMVVALRGALEIDLVGRIDSHNGGIRSTFESVPDAPVSKFVLRMKGGAKGLLVNSTDICRGSHRASVGMRAQNGRAASLRPSLENTSCGGDKKLGKHKKHQ